MSDDWERQKELAKERVRERERAREEEQVRAKLRAAEREMIRKQKAGEDAGIVRQNGKLIDLRGTFPLSLIYRRPDLDGDRGPNERDATEESYPGDDKRVVYPQGSSRRTFHSWRDRLPEDSPYKPAGDQASAEQYLADLLARLDLEDNKEEP